jgi:hypothetical protein
LLLHEKIGSASLPTTASSIFIQDPAKVTLVVNVEIFGRLPIGRRVQTQFPANIPARKFLPRMTIKKIDSQGWIGK